ncbi:HAD family hydrolase [Nocardioides sp. zg-ZUI104]|uniref:HAD family hydrolase n=1 Tax=Nocardioides faecalis TaxID=2803858 RepID=UPI001BD02AE0|nr:HAD family hydrolase [Nocardioides faecalis]MBS4752023.1 HAD family hydrolase [Nocardioides faecalis]
MTFRALLLDLDDTLVDHRGAAERGLRGWLAGLGLGGDTAETEALVERWFTLEARHYPRAQRRELSYTEHRRARVRAFLPGWDLADDALADEVYGGFLDCYRSAWRAFADAAASIEAALGAGLRVGVLTNGEHAVQSEKLRRTGLLYPDVAVFASSALPAAKPDRRAYEAACRGLGVSPETTLMVGDSLRHDVLGAQATGLHARLLRRPGQYDATPVPHGVRVLRGLDELRWSVRRSA